MFFVLFVPQVTMLIMQDVKKDSVIIIILLLHLVMLRKLWVIKRFL